MEIVDAQIHAPPTVRPLDPGHDGAVDLLVKCEMAREAMDSVGVDVALVNSRQEVLDYFVERYPDRFAGCVTLEATAPDLEERIATYRDCAGMLAVRVQVVDWKTRTVRPDVEAGGLDGVLTAAERHRLPVFCSAMGVPHAIGPFAEAHPDLTLIVDHLGLSSPPPMRRADPDPWSSLPEVLALARFPNVALKFSGANALSREPYPHPDLWPRLHRIIDAFGPERLMWGSDFTRLRMGVGTTDRGPREEWGGLYSDAVNYLRDTAEISRQDKETIFAGTIRRLLRWPRADNGAGRSR